MAQGTEVERLAAIIAQHGAPSPSFDTALAERLLSAGVTLPPEPKPEPQPEAWVEEAARVLVDTWYPDKGKGEDVYAAVRALARLWGYDLEAGR